MPICNHHHTDQWPGLISSCCELHFSLLPRQRQLTLFAVHLAANFVRCGFFKAKKYVSRFKSSHKLEKDWFGDPINSRFLGSPRVYIPYTPQFKKLAFEPQCSVHGNINSLLFQQKCRMFYDHQTEMNICSKKSHFHLWLLNSEIKTITQKISLKKLKNTRFNFQCHKLNKHTHTHTHLTALCPGLPG